MSRPTKRDRRFATFRLLEADRMLLKKLGSPDSDGESTDRHAALIAVARIIKEIEVPALDNRRQPMRIGIPAELDHALEEKQQQTGQTAIAILLAGAREYLSRQSKRKGSISETPKVLATKKRGRPRKATTEQVSKGRVQRKAKT